MSTSSVTRLAQVFVILLSLGLGVRQQAYAQTDSEHWSPPENLSRSGAASAPLAIAQPDGSVRVIWWDAIDGVTFVEGRADNWSDPEVAPVTVVEVLEQPQADGTTELRRSISAMPLIFGDATGTAHALWVAEPDRDTGATALLYAQLSAERATWTDARVVAESVSGFDLTTDGDGHLYLAYGRTLNNESDPSGIVFRESRNSGDQWSQPVTIHNSRYYRVAASDQLNIRIAADAEGLVAIAWNDPQLGHALLARSTDAGESWSEPQRVGDDDEQATNAHPLILSSDSPGGALLIWQGVGGLGGCALYQAPMMEDIAVGTRAAGARVLDSLDGCPAVEGEQLLLLDTQRAIYLTGSGTETLILSLWNGETWSESKHLTFRAEQPETGAVVYLGELQAALLLPAIEGAEASPEDDEEVATTRAGALAARAELAGLAVVGVGSDGDIWFSESQLSALDLAFAPPSPWSLPLALLQSASLPDVPVMAADAEGAVHALWSELEQAGSSIRVLRYARWSGTNWTRVTTVWRAEEGSAVEPSIVAAGDRLHAVWNDGLDRQILYSRAFLRDAGSTAGWDTPLPLPGPPGASGMMSQPQILASDAGGRLHAIYAVQVNEARGVYYTSSIDEGVTWSEAAQVFDAVGAGWAAVDSPRLAVDAGGSLHAVWMHASLASDNPSLGLYYAYSTDGGRSWSEPLRFAEGAYVWPNVVTDAIGGVHLFWAQVAGPRLWWHQWSPSTTGVERDLPAGWMRAVRIPGFSDVEGPLAIVGDDALGVQVVGLGLDRAGEPALLRQSWSTEVAVVMEEVESEEARVQEDGQWAGLETYRLDPVPAAAGVSAVLQPDSTRLDVLYRAETPVGDSSTQPGLWHTSRAISATTLSPDVQALAELWVGEAPEAVSPVDGSIDEESAPPAPTEVPATLLPAPAEEQAQAAPSLVISAGLATLVVSAVFGLRLLVKSRGRAPLN